MKNMKKGFTLAELIGVFVLIAAISLLVGITVTRSLKDAKAELLNKQNDMLKGSIALWAAHNKPSNNTEYHITLSQLKKASLIDADIKHVKTGEFLPNDMLLKVINEDGVLMYEITDTGNCKGDYLLTPQLSFDDVVYTEINTPYIDVIATATSDGTTLNNVTSSGNVDITRLGVNYITYNIYKDGYCNTGIKNVVVVDTTSPVISFNGNITINASQVNSYNYLTGVTATDNSLETPTLTYEKNFPAVAGKYSIKYIAKDSSGNTTEKYRTVVVN